MGAGVVLVCITGAGVATGLLLAAGLMAEIFEAGAVAGIGEPTATSQRCPGCPWAGFIFDPIAGADGFETSVGAAGVGKPGDCTGFCVAGTNPGEVVGLPVPLVLVGKLRGFKVCSLWIPPPELSQEVNTINIRQAG